MQNSTINRDYQPILEAREAREAREANKPEQTAPVYQLIAAILGGTVCLAGMAVIVCFLLGV